MAKARREIEEKLHLIDVVVELLDARAPMSSENPMLQEIIQNKPRVILLMKKDLADPVETDRWIEYFQKKNIPTLAIDVNNTRDVQRAIQRVEQAGRINFQRAKEKGMHKRPVRAMIIGIPNVGKSSFINRIAQRKATKIGDRPGITRGQHWIKVFKDFELLDTPGILWPKFDDEVVGYRLATIGTIKDHLLPLQDVAAFLIAYLQENYPQALKERYDLDNGLQDMWEIFDQIGRKRGAIESGGKVNFDRVAQIILGDLRNGHLGRITLEVV